MGIGGRLVRGREPDEFGDGGEEEGDGYGEDCEREEEAGVEICTFPPFAVRLRWMGHPGFGGWFEEDVLAG